jgi:hypothetical protein
MGGYDLTTEVRMIGNQNPTFGDVGHTPNGLHRAAVLGDEAR